MDSRVDIILSILVISHNQRHLLSRCLDSILKQKLKVSYEIIVSDDRSSDGTWELIEEYTRKFPDIIRGVKCNSDECNPVNNSERCGWNKANAYKHAKGKFFVNIDADDYLKSDDIYQKQIDMLMANPDCSMCQQRVWQVNEGSPMESGNAWPSHPKLKEGVKLNAKEIMQNDLQGMNQTYMIRQNPDDNPAKKLGKWFNDTYITLYYLQFGKVIFIDRSDYVWVQYDSSISHSFDGDDRLVLYALLPYRHALMIPSLKELLVTRPNLPMVHLLKKSMLHKVSMQPNTIRFLAQFNGFIFDYYTGEQRGIIKRIRLFQILLLYKQIKFGKKTGEEPKKKLYNLLLGK